MKEAFITLLSSENYLDGALALFESYKEHNSRYPFVIAVTENINNPQITNPIKRSGALVEIIPQLQYTEVVRNHWKDNPVLNTASKYELFNLKQYDKLVYIDADTYILSNIDNLMEYPDGSMIYNPDYKTLGGDRYGFSGAYVFKPENHEIEFYRVLNEKFNMVDGELLGKAWFFVMDSPSHQLPVSYCIGYNYWIHNPHVPANILHFSGEKKPWLVQFPLNNAYIKHYYQIIDKIQQYKENFSWKSIFNHSFY